MNKLIKCAFTILFVLSLAFNLAIAQEPLSWQDCLKEAAKNHPDLIAAQENINQQKAAKAITASGLYPQINASLDASTAKTSGTTTDSYKYGVTGSQLMFDGSKTVNNLKAASQTLKGAQENYKFTSSEVRLNLRTAFINLLKAQELINVAEDIVKIRRDNLELVTLSYQSGLEHKGAMLTAEANLLGATFELAQAKRDVVLAQRQLIKEMGRKEFEPLSVKAEFTVSDTAKEKPDLEALARNNPSLLQAVSKKNAASFSIKSAYANFAPQLSGSASANKSSSRWPPQNDQWNLGLGLTMPIFEGGLRLAQVSQAQALYNQLDANERSTRDAIVVALEQTWVALQDAIGIVAVQRKSLDAAQERSNIAEAQYSTGFISFDNWIIIEDSLVSAKKAYLNSQANALLTEANWIQAKGETLEYAKY